MVVQSLLLLSDLLNPSLEQGVVHASTAAGEFFPLYVFGTWFLINFVGGGWLLFRR